MNGLVRPSGDAGPLLRGRMTAPASPWAIEAVCVFPIREAAVSPPTAAIRVGENVGSGHRRSRVEGGRFYLAEALIPCRRSLRRRFPRRRREVRP